MKEVTSRALDMITAYADSVAHNDTIVADEIRRIARHVAHEFQFKMLPAPSQVLDIVCRVFAVHPKKVCGKDRTRKYVLARKAYCVLMRDNTNMTLSEIGRYINRTYSAVLYLTGHHESDMEFTPVYRLAFTLASKELCKELGDSSNDARAAYQIMEGRI